MNQDPFSKPSPADPLPLDVWLDKTDRAEVGREPFFRGRDKEYDVFRRSVNSLRAGLVGGGTMIFQGAPGAGKSALLGECIEAVRCHSTPNDPWVAAAIRPETLESATQFMGLLVQAVSEENDGFRKGFLVPILFLKKLWIREGLFLRHWWTEELALVQYRWEQSSKQKTV